MREMKDIAVNDDGPMEPDRQAVAQRVEDRALLRFLDDELGVGETSWVEAHLRATPSAIKRLFRLMADRARLSRSVRFPEPDAGDFGAADLLSIARDGSLDRYTRGGAILRLGHIRATPAPLPEILRALLPLAEESGSGVQVAALDAIGRFGPSAWSERVRETLHSLARPGTDAGLPIRSAAVRAIGSVCIPTEDNGSKDLLLGVVASRDEPRRIREAGIEALSSVRDRDVSRAFGEVAADQRDRWLIRSVAIRALPNVSGVGVAGFLERLRAAETDHLGVRVAAAEALAGFVPVLTFAGLPYESDLRLTATRGEGHGVEICGAIGPFEFEAFESRPAGQAGPGIDICISTRERCFFGRSIRIVIGECADVVLQLRPTRRGDVAKGSTELMGADAAAIIDLLRSQAAPPLRLAWTGDE